MIHRKRMKLESLGLVEWMQRKKALYESFLSGLCRKYVSGCRSWLHLFGIHICLLFPIVRICSWHLARKTLEPNAHFTVTQICCLLKSWKVSGIVWKLMAMGGVVTWIYSRNPRSPWVNFNHNYVTCMVQVF